MKKKIIVSIFGISFLVIGINAFSMGSEPITAPGQPETGYGSTENYINETLLGGGTIDHHNCIDFGDTMAGTRCWVYVPENLKNGTTAPVVIYLHGFMALVPPIYAGQVEHLVKQGYIVIFPEYNLGGFMGMFNDLNQYDMLERAVTAVDDALALPEVASRAELDNIILASHSNGGLMSLGWAAGGGVPVKSMVMTHPNISNDAIPQFVRDLFMGGFVELPFETMAQDITCPVIIIGGQNDTIAKPEHVQQVYDSLTDAISKVYYEFIDDAYGKAALQSDHMAACQDDGIIPGWLLDLVGKSMGFGAMEEDAIDYRIHYAAVDAALDCKTSLQFDMGKWSDGTSVEPVSIIEEEITDLACDGSPILPGDDDAAGGDDTIAGDDDDDDDSSEEGGFPFLPGGENEGCGCG